MTGERRARMVELQLAARGIGNARVLAAMRAVPRHEFVSPALQELAYDDRALPIDCGQTISQPYVVALMIEALELAGPERVLEVGTGSGYAAAVLAHLAAEVYTIERRPELAEAASARLARLGCANARVRCGDGTLGWPEAAPYDGILVSAGGPRVPAALETQLALGGRLVIPVGASRHAQMLVRLRRVAPDRLERDELGEVSFVPLVGAEGFGGA